MDLRKFDKYLKENKKINEGSLKDEIAMQKRINKACSMGKEAFFKAMKSEMKEAKTDNVDSYSLQEFDRSCMNITKHWVQMNMPKPKMDTIPIPGV